MMLRDKVVVVAGVGPGLGRAIALASAREGADVVLAARTASRLDDVAKEVSALGRRAVVVPGDLTDAGAAGYLADAAAEEFGRVDALVYNALAMPPIKDLTSVDLDAIGESFDANVVAALRLTRLFTEALAASRGSVVMVNSMVVRFSQRRMGPYKLAKAALLAMAQSLATELGPRGIRVNSVAPGHIWGDSLKWYFGYLAHKRGVEIQDDLRRDRGGHRPGPAARARRGGRRGGVPGLAAGPRDHRAVPGRQLRRVPPLSALDDLHASASRITGLADFGPDDYTDGLGVLLESYERDAGLTPLGAKATRSLLRGALVARLLSEAGWQSHPGYAEVAVQRPVFVTGLPRTGTTALHRLLVADPAHQGLELWLAEAPRPRPPRPAWAGDPVFQHIQAACARHHVEHPEFMGVHYIAADQVEECWQLLRQSMRSVSFECLAHLPGYSAWLRDQDWAGAYRRHRRNLQLIGLNDAGRRWVLKNPSHLFALDALLAVYPDALVIQTHRDPRTAIASVCSLAAQACEGWSETFRGSVIGRDQLALWASGLERFTAERARHDPARFYDVGYEEFTADPFGTVEAAYGYFGLPLSGAAADAMRSLIVADAAGRDGGTGTRWPTSA